MLRRSFLAVGAVAGSAFTFPGCRGTQFARVIKPGEKEMIGSHQAGQETFRPLVDEAVTKLVARHPQPRRPARRRRRRAPIKSPRRPSSRR